jgi:hypothetical protein
VPEDNLGQIGRRPSAPGSQQVSAEELLAELVRLVECSGLALKRPPPVEIVPEQDSLASEPAQALEMKSRRLSPNAHSTNPKETAVVAVEPPESRKSDISYLNNANGIGLKAGRRSGAWTFRVSALVLAGAAVIGSVFWLEQIMSKPPKAPPFSAAAESPPAVQPRSNLSVAASSDAGLTLPRDVTQPAAGKVVSPEERPIDQNAREALENPPPSQDLGPAAIGVAQPAAPPAGEAPAAAANTPAAAEPATAPQSLDSKDMRPVSLPPDPTQIATPTPSATDSSLAAQASDAPLPPVRPPPKAAVQTGGVAQRSTPKLDSPTKPSSQSGAHVVAKAGATGPGAPETKTLLKSAQASVEPQAAPSGQPAPARQQPNPNPVVRAFSNMVGAVAGLIPFAPH